jgi:hypothetical protein
MKLTTRRQVRRPRRAKVASLTNGALHWYELIPSLKINANHILKSSFARSRRATNTATPATSEPSHSSDGEILTDDSLQFKDATSSEESVSEFEEDSLSDASQLAIGDMSLSDSESQPIAKRSGRHTPAKPEPKGRAVEKKKPKRANGASFKIGGSSFMSASKGATKKQAGRKSAAGTDVSMELGGWDTGLREDGDTDEEMMKAAIQASYVTAAQEISASLMSAGAGPSTSRGTRMSMSVSPKKGQSLSPTKRGVRKSKAILSDSESDSPLASKAVKNRRKKKAPSPSDVIELSSSESEYNGSAMEVDTIDLSDEEPEAVDSGLDDDDEEEELQPAKKAWKRRGPLTAEEKAAKLELQALENKERKKLGRRLTFVSIGSACVNLCGAS